MLLKYLIFILFQFWFLIGFAQSKFTFSGNIIDSIDGIALNGASILVKELDIGTTSNDKGYYSLTLPADNYTIEVSNLGYKTVVWKINLQQETKKDFKLEILTQNIEEVVVVSEEKAYNVTSTTMSVNTLGSKEMSTLPILYGEFDILRMIQLLPGIKGKEDKGGFFIRGGGKDQNLVLLDEAPVYNVSHLLGLLSVFNNDAIQDVTLYKGHIPASYGGRASSVVDIRLKEGSLNKWRAKASLGSLATKLSVEGPIVKDKASFIISSRRSLFDLILKALANNVFRNFTYNIFDINAKVNFKLGENDFLSLSGFSGRDVIKVVDFNSIDYENHTATARWKHIINDKFQSSTIGVFSKYNFNRGLNRDLSDKKEINMLSSMQSLKLKNDFEYTLNENNTLKFGVSAIYHKFSPGQVLADQKLGISSDKLQNKFAWEPAIYISEDLSISNRWKLNTGLRYSWFAQVGPGDINTYDSDGAIENTTSYKKSEIVKSYGGIEPRIGLTYMISKDQSVKASYGRNRQYLHLLSNSNADISNELWIPSSKNVKPQIVDQFALGYFKNFRGNEYESSIEIYYKDMKNQVDYKNGAKILLNNDVESNLLFGIGKAYGIECFLRKKRGKFKGWISYSLSRSERQFDGINYGVNYPASWDRTHDFSIAGSYEYSPKYTISSNFVFHTGDAVTFPMGKYSIEGLPISLYATRNADRFPNYHRLDLSITQQLKSKKRYESYMTFSIYNLYARRNANKIWFQKDPKDPSKTQAVRLSIFTFVPSMTYRFIFK